MLRLMSEVLAGRRPPIRLAGHSFLPVAAGALYWESEDTLLVADLHLEKGAAFAARGMMLPPYDTRSTLQRLAACLDHFSPRRVVALGDSFHRSELAGRLSADDRAESRVLRGLMESRRAIHAVGVEQRQRGIPQRRRALHQRLGERRSLEKAECGRGVKLDVHRAGGAGGAGG